MIFAILTIDIEIFSIDILHMNQRMLQLYDNITQDIYVQYGYQDRVAKIIIAEKQYLEALILAINNLTQRLIEWTRI